MFLVALSAGVICAVIVAAYFIAIDQQRRTAAVTNGAFAAPGTVPYTTLLHNPPESNPC